jgi:hypothetical protein
MLPVSGAAQLKPHDLAERRVFDVAEPGAVLALGQEEVPQAPLARLGLQLFQDWRHLPAGGTGAELVHEGLLVRVDVLSDEVRELLHVHPGARRICEVHAALLGPAQAGRVEG